MKPEDLRDSIKETLRRADSLSEQIFHDHCLGDVITAAENWLMVMRLEETQGSIDFTAPTEKYGWGVFDNRNPSQPLIYNRHQTPEAALKACFDAKDEESTDA